MFKLLKKIIKKIIRICKIIIREIIGPKAPKEKLPAPELDNNKKLINTHQGECFVLGNGPSLKRIDLEKLRDKFVITCNMFIKVSGYEKVCPNAHVVVDNVFFGKRPDCSIEKKELDEMWEKICGMKVPIFVPLSVKDFIIENGIDKKADIYYLDIIRSHLPDRRGTPLKVDITKKINSYTNVVQFAIVVAINMGFTKINLLGCDGTVIYGYLNAAADNQNIETHGYDNDSYSKKLYLNKVQKNKLAENLYWEFFSYLGFERLNELCKKREIQLLNLTDKTLIDGVPKANGSAFYIKHELASELAENKRFVDSHKGEECFILGNGPSLKRVDLEKLRDKFVITCNMFIKVNGYEKVCSNAHVVVDNFFFGKRQDCIANISELKGIWEKICDMNTPVFVPLSVKDFIVENGIDKKADIYYLDVIRNHLPDRRGTPLKVDMTKAVNSYTNVVQFAIMIAMNMGFTKINLLGCDGTSIYGFLDVVKGNQKTQTHAYDDNTGVKAIYSNMINKNKLSDALYWQSFSYLGFERLYELCKQRGIQLINLTDETLVDGVPRGDGSKFYLG